MPSRLVPAASLLVAGTLLLSTACGEAPTPDRTTAACRAAASLPPDGEATEDVRAWSERRCVSTTTESERTLHPICDELLTADVDAADPLGDETVRRLAEAIRRAAEYGQGRLRRGLLAFADLVAASSDGGGGPVDVEQERLAEHALSWVESNCPGLEVSLPETGREPAPEDRETCQHLQAMTEARQRFDGREADAAALQALTEAAASAPDEIRLPLESMLDSWPELSDGTGPSAAEVYDSYGRPIGLWFYENC